MLLLKYIFLHCSKLTIVADSGSWDTCRGLLFIYTDTNQGKEVIEKKYDGYYSSTKTCEMSMSEAVKENYESILYLVDEAL